METTIREATAEEVRLLNEFRQLKKDEKRVLRMQHYTRSDKGEPDHIGTFFHSLNGFAYRNDLKWKLRACISLEKRGLAAKRFIDTKQEHFELRATERGQKIRNLLDVEETLSLPIPETSRTVKLGKAPITLQPGRAGALINELMLFSSRDELRPALTGVYVHENGMVSTDGHILISVEGGTGVKSPRIFHRTGDVEKTDRYPDWRSVIPTSTPDKVFTVDTVKAEPVLEQIAKQYAIEEQTRHALIKREIRLTNVDTVGVLNPRLIHLAVKTLRKIEIREAKLNFRNGDISKKSIYLRGVSCEAIEFTGEAGKFNVRILVMPIIWDPKTGYNILDIPGFSE